MGLNYFQALVLEDQDREVMVLNACIQHNENRLILDHKNLQCETKNYIGSESSGIRPDP